MKAFGMISLLITLGIIGYMMAEQQKPGGNGEIGAVEAKKAEDVAANMMAREKLRDVTAAVQAYKAEKGKFPPDLQALVDAGSLARVPGGLQYNAETGEVSVAP